MRWLVEVSSIGKTDLQKFCVEAESWQRALQAARAQRGEEGPMSGFSIELLEEGYRAVDPVSRIRFVVKRAPDDMPITAPVAKDGKGVAPSPQSTGVAPAAAVAAAAAPSPASVSVAKANPSANPSPSATDRLPPSPTSSVPSAGGGKKSVPPRPMTDNKTSTSNGPASSALKKGLTFNNNASPADTLVTDTKAIEQATASSALNAAAVSVASTTASMGTLAQSPSPPAVTKMKSERPPPPSVAPPASIGPVSVGSPLPGLPSVKVLSSREQDPTDASPLTYREYSFAVPAGTSEDVAVEVLRGQLKLVDGHLTNAKMGKLVNLAVFDVEFVGKPPGPPLATLSWKDWKGDPVIGYPRRGKGQKQVKPPSNAPPPMAGAAGAAGAAAVAPVSVAIPVSNPNPSSQLFPPPNSFPPGTIARPQAAPSPSPSPSPVPPVVAPVMPVAQQQPIPVPVPAQNPFTSTSPLISPAMLPPQQPPQQQQQQQPHPASVPPPAMTQSQPPPAMAMGAGGIPVPVVSPVAVFTPQQPGSMPPPGGSAPPPPHAFGSVPPPPAFPPPQQHAPPVITQSQPPPPPAVLGYIPQLPPPPQQPPPQQPQQQQQKRPSHPAMATPGPDGMVRTPSGRFVRGRTTGDELITALFESMHDLHFLRDALDGGQFCLALATEVLPARAAIIHFYDIEKREWVVACTRGKDTGKLLTLRTPEGDELLRDAARNRRAVVTGNANGAKGQRYQTLGGSRSMIIAPIMQAGRALGAIEIINPLDGMPFTEDEGNAMTYIAEQYAEYLGSRGIVLDRERIQSAAAPSR